MSTGKKLSIIISAYNKAMYIGQLLDQVKAVDLAEFGLDKEITSRLLASGNSIVEVPISYFPRSKEEGKKIGFSDWVRGVKTFIHFGKHK